MRAIAKHKLGFAKGCMCEYANGMVGYTAPGGILPMFTLKLEDVRTMSMTATEGFGMVELKLFGDHGALASVKVMSPVAEKVYDWFDARLK